MKIIFVVASIVAVVLGCSTFFPNRTGPAVKPLDQVPLKPLSGNTPGRIPSAVNSPEWGPNVNLLAARTALPQIRTAGRMNIPEEWWVTPIHANLLPTGQVLISGWARANQKQCAFHTGRQWPVSFMLNIDPGSAAPEGTSGDKLLVQPINEAPEMDGINTELIDSMYCAGHVPMRDGSVFFVGGARYANLEFGFFDSAQVNGGFEDEYGVNYARIFKTDFQTGTGRFQRVEARFPEGPESAEIQELGGGPSAVRKWTRFYEKGMMWYPTGLRLPGGSILVAGGFARQSGPFDPSFLNRGLAIFHPGDGGGSWQSLVPHRKPRGEDDPINMLNISGFDYVHMFLLPKPRMWTTASGPRSYQVLLWGGLNRRFGFLSLDPGVPTEERIFVPPAGSGLSGPARPPAAGLPPGQGQDTTAVMLPDGKVVMVGGGLSGQNEAQRIDLYDPYANTWREPLLTGVSRIRAATVLLPNGKVMIFNGEEHWDGQNVGNRRVPVVYDPATHQARAAGNEWPGDKWDRGYHNIAILLKDGRVLVGGGRNQAKLPDSPEEIFRIGCERPDLRLFAPAELRELRRPVVTPVTETGDRPTPPLRLVVGNRTRAIRLAWEGPPLKQKTGGAVLMSLAAHTHHFNQNQSMVKLPYRILAPTSAGGRVLNQIEILPPSSSWQAPEGYYNLYLVTTEGSWSEGLTVQVESN